MFLAEELRRFQQEEREADRRFQAEVRQAEKEWQERQKEADRRWQIKVAVAAAIFALANGIVMFILGQIAKP